MSAVSFIRPEPTDTLEGLGVHPGWYVRHAGCSIWFEVIEVFGQWAQCVARDPKQGTALVSIGRNFSSIDEFCTGQPGSLRSISKTREKNFYDKFHPELDRIVPAA